MTSKNYVDDMIDELSSKIQARRDETGVEPPDGSDAFAMGKYLGIKPEYEGDFCLGHPFTKACRAQMAQTRAFLKRRG